jgi:hypothetical protein
MVRSILVMMAQSASIMFAASSRPPRAYLEIRDIQTCAGQLVQDVK